MRRSRLRFASSWVRGIILQLTRHMMPRSLALLSALALLALAATAQAQSGPIGFQSPSKNITCQFFTDDKQNALRCDIVNMEITPNAQPIAISNGAAPSR